MPTRVGGPAASTSSSQWAIPLRVQYLRGLGGWLDFDRGRSRRGLVDPQALEAGFGGLGARVVDADVALEIRYGQRPLFSVRHAHGSVANIMQSSSKKTVHLARVALTRYEDTFGTFPAISLIQNKNPRTSRPGIFLHV